MAMLYLKEDSNRGTATEANPGTTWRCCMRAIAVAAFGLVLLAALCALRALPALAVQRTVLLEEFVGDD
jgi:hypothetical protein